MRRGLLWGGVLGGLVLGLPAEAEAKPLAPGVFCEVYAGELLCVGGPPDCKLCHVSTNPVAMNPFGEAVSSALTAYADKPFVDAEFAAGLPLALADIEEGDADGDGVTNLDEILAGSLPGSAQSTPQEAVCPEDVSELDYKICEYDLRYSYRKVATDFCGISPTFDETEAFVALSDEEQRQVLHAKLDACLDSEFWLGENGVLWNVAHRKVRPVGTLIGFANFFYDYEYFTYTQIDGHSVRDVLVGQYLVERSDVGTPEEPKSVYAIVAEREDQPLQPERRVGMVTTAWPLFYNTMFTALPRGTAAQAYRAFLGFDIAASEGLNWPVASEPVDYDQAGVQETECAGCHSTLDPLAYPFATYNGLQSDASATFFMYDPDRIDKYFAFQQPGLSAMPEAGVIMGQPVADLLEWAQVAAESDPFFMATTADYWRLLIGEEPSPEHADRYAEYTTLWQGLRDSDSVEAMLHELIDTEAYGAP